MGTSSSSTTSAVAPSIGVPIGSSPPSDDEIRANKLAIVASVGPYVLMSRTCAPDACSHLSAAAGDILPPPTTVQRMVGGSGIPVAESQSVRLCQYAVGKSSAVTRCASATATM